MSYRTFNSILQTGYMLALLADGGQTGSPGRGQSRSTGRERSSSPGRGLNSTVSNKRMLRLDKDLALPSYLPVGGQAKLSGRGPRKGRERGVIADRVIPGFNLLRPGVVQRDWPASS